MMSLDCEAVRRELYSVKAEIDDLLDYMGDRLSISNKV